ncbi:MAG TPA: hypothetical protein VH575_04605 [Gemmataceae bacterium]
MATIWEANTGREIVAATGHGVAVLCAAFSPDGQRIVSVSNDRRVHVWDAGNGKPVSPSLRYRDAVALAAFRAGAASPAGGAAGEGGKPSDARPRPLAFRSCLRSKSWSVSAHRRRGGSCVSWRTEHRRRDRRARRKPPSTA